MITKNGIDLQSNDMVSSLRGIELKNFLQEVENTYLTYRKSLLLPSNVTFGVEIEYEGIEQNSVNFYIEHFLPCWQSKSDGSIKVGGEVVSPVLEDDLKSWKDIKNICHFLKSIEVKTTKAAGGHIHVGAPIMGNDITAWNTFSDTWMLYEHIFFRFFYGDKVNARPKIWEYAKPESESLYFKRKERLKCKSMPYLDCYFPLERRIAVNFNNVDFENVYSKRYKNTIEFRCPNATIEEVIWQNNINTCTKFMLAAATSAIDTDFLEYKLGKTQFEPKSDICYQEVCLKDCLELVDLIFDNNLDKLYFLRQYLKGFQSVCGAKKMIFAKKFIK